MLKSHSTYSAQDPLLHLHGGPGYGVLGRIEKFASAFEPWRATRDIVMFDQRAAGLSSNSVSCFDVLTTNIVDIALGKFPELTESADDNRPSQVMQDCLAELANKDIDLAQYNTLQNALDVPMVMSTLGYDSYNIYGVSYGTKLALEVMRSAPQGLRAVILDGVAPPQVALYDALTTPLDEAMLGLVKHCAEDEACNSAYPNLGSVLNDVLERAVAGTLSNNSQPVPLDFVLAPILERNGSIGRPSLTPYLPAYIYELANGGEMPTVKWLSEQNFILADPSLDEVHQRAEALSEEQQQLVELALMDGEVVETR